MMNVDITNQLVGDLLDQKVEQVDARRHPGAFSSASPSPYQQSPLSDSIIEQDAKDNPEALYGAKEPHYAILHEKPQHRVMIYLAAQGHTVTEIADLTGFTTVCVNNVLRQPWAQKRITEEIANSGRSKVEMVLKGSQLAAIERLIAEMDNPDARPSERINAADKILDRVMGKPNQPLTISEGKSLDQMSDAEIAAELSKIQGERN